MVLRPPSRWIATARSCSPMSGSTRDRARSSRSRATTARAAFARNRCVEEHAGSLKRAIKSASVRTIVLSYRKSRCFRLLGHGPLRLEAGVPSSPSLPRGGSQPVGETTCGLSEVVCARLSLLGRSLPREGLKQSLQTRPKADGPTPVKQVPGARKQRDRIQGHSDQQPPLEPLGMDLPVAPSHDQPLYPPAMVRRAPMPLVPRTTADNHTRLRLGRAERSANAGSQAAQSAKSGRNAGTSASRGARGYGATEQPPQDHLARVGTRYAAG